MNNQLVFFDIQDRYEALSRFGDPLEDLHKMVPWTTFRKPLKKELTRDAQKCASALSTFLDDSILWAGSFCEA